MAEVAYSSLDGGKKEIRLLELQPGRCGTELRGNLRIVGLIAKPQYEALSYTWDLIAENRKILLDGNATLPLSDNLYRAFQRLRFRLRKRVLWIDHICINQSDIVERSNQVAFMGDIYGACKLCLICLGHVDDASMKQTPRFVNFKLAYSFIQHCFWFTDSHFVNILLTRRQDPLLYQTFFKCCSHKAFGIIPGTCFAYAPTLLPWHLLRILHCGSTGRGFDKNIVSAAVNVFVLGFQLENTSTRIQMLHLWHGPKLFRGAPTSTMLPGEALSFLDRIKTMHQSRDYGSSYTWRSRAILPIFSTEPCLEVCDPKGKVYSLTALLGPEEREIIGTDSSVSCTEVFARATASTMAKSGQGFVAFAFVSFAPPNQGLSGLPTWTSNFSYLPLQRKLEYDAVDPSQTRPLPDYNCEPLVSVDIENNWKILHLKGILLDSAAISFSFSLSGNSEWAMRANVSIRGQGCPTHVSETFQFP